MIENKVITVSVFNGSLLTVCFVIISRTNLVEMIAASLRNRLCCASEALEFGWEYFF